MYENKSQCSERDELIGRYSRLRNEYEILKGRISHSIASKSYSEASIYRKDSMYSSSSSTTSPTGSTSSALWPQSYSPPASPSNQYQAYGMTALPHVLTPPAECYVADQYALLDLNGQIKATLTALLNCDSVKRDGRLRAWVQERLMEAEHDMRRQRKRRSGVDRDTRKGWEHFGQRLAGAHA